MFGQNHLHVVTVDDVCFAASPQPAGFEVEGLVMAAGRHSPCVE